MEISSFGRDQTGAARQADGSSTVRFSSDILDGAPFGQALPSFVPMRRFVLNQLDLRTVRAINNQRQRHAPWCVKTLACSGPSGSEVTSLRCRDTEGLSAFCPASLLGFPRRSLPRSHSLLNGKVFQLCASFQFLSQPDGLRSSSGPRVARPVTVLDRHLSPFK